MALFGPLEMEGFVLAITTIEHCLLRSWPDKTPRLCVGRVFRCLVTAPIAASV